MTRGTRPPRRASLDDEAIGLLVRDVVGDWSMPAVRLDAPSWRDRVRGPRTRLMHTARLGLGRAGRAATAALALTVVAALAAVVITHPPAQPGASPNPTGQSSGQPPAGLASPLPRVILGAGDLPFPNRILVENETGDIALVDLTLGEIGGSIARSQYPSSLTVSASGVVVCICITTAKPVAGYPTELDVRLKTFTRTTTKLRDDAVDVLSGTPDPRSPDMAADHAWTSVSFSPDDRYAYLGWSTRATPVWHSGIDIVDIGTGTVTSKLALPDMTAGDGDARRTVGAPRVLGPGSDGTLLIARSWAEWGSDNVALEPARVGDDGSTATVVDGVASGLTPFPEAANCGPSFVRAGARPGGGFWVTCQTNTGTLTLRRLAADGTSLGSESMARTGFVDGDTTAVSPDGQMFYAWDPGSWTLTSIDLSTGKRANARLVTAAAAGAGADPVTALGRWLAPSADAKSILRGAILVSPDSRRLYVLAAQPVVDERLPTGSAGILVVDAATLQVLDHWPPPADLMSMALNADGSLLYAAGLPGVDASGVSSLRQGASVTVFDTASGAQRLVAGQLGMGMLSFPGPLVP
ncbi:MAG TPA: hypothetical protein VHL56_00935 [Candidatus Limnocylindrales bacterium]|nr:hypothetical protein [Candidatus Limnocylindrales bacterium]